jgi:hypothetical protein
MGENVRDFGTFGRQMVKGVDLTAFFLWGSANCSISICWFGPCDMALNT